MPPGQRGFLLVQNQPSDQRYPLICRSRWRVVQDPHYSGMQRTVRRHMPQREPLLPWLKPGPQFSIYRLLLPWPCGKQRRVEVACRIGVCDWVVFGVVKWL